MGFVVDLVAPLELDLFVVVDCFLEEWVTRTVLVAVLTTDNVRIPVDILDVVLVAGSDLNSWYLLAPH